MHLTQAAISTFLLQTSSFVTTSFKTRLLSRTVPPSHFSELTAVRNLPDVKLDLKLPRPRWGFNKVPGEYRSVLTQILNLLQLMGPNDSHARYLPGA